MLDELLFDKTVPAQRMALVSRDGRTAWGALQASARDACLEHYELGRQRVGLCFQASTAGLATLAALARLQCDAFLIDCRLPEEEALRLCRRFRLGALLRPAAADTIGVRQLESDVPAGGQATVTILTSGSTGRPKAARHTWQSLFRPVRQSPQNQAPCWLLAYRPHLYAGLQVLLQCLVNSGTLAVPDAEDSPQEIVDLMLRAGVQFASATPSYWRKLLLFGDHRKLGQIGLRQATLGGEAVDQQMLDWMREVFPKARLVHIFATTELGRCFSVGDGRAGFPSSYLNQPLADGVELKIEEGELLARSPYSMQGYDGISPPGGKDEGWVRTGDLVEVNGDRVHFLGRRSEIINVGGNKVHPIEVERVVRAVAGVADARVFAKKSSIAGQLVACEIVPARGEDEKAVKERIAEACRKELAPHQWPRIIRSTEKIVLSGAGKTLRSA